MTVAGSTTSTYYCRTDHIHSTANPWQQIFGGLSLGENTDYLKKVHIWVSSGFENSTDGIAMKRNSITDYNYAYENYIMTNVTGPHLWLEAAEQKANNTFYQVAPWDNVDLRPDFYNEFNTGQNRSWLLNEHWTKILRMPSFNIIADEYDCETLVGTSRTFSIQLWDRRDRQSTVYYHTMSIKTAGLIYSDQGNEVKTTNDQSGTIFMQPNMTLLGGNTEILLSMI